MPKSKSLLEIQANFIADMDNSHVKGSYVDSGNIAGANLINIYKNNRQSSLIAALKITYPATMQLTGEDFFTYLATEYLKKYPCKEGYLQNFGADMPQFISDFTACQNLPYLADVAQLEWAMDMAYNAVDCLATDLSHEWQSSQYGQINNSCGFISSHFPVFAIWQFDGKNQLDIGDGTKPVGFVIVVKHKYEVKAVNMTQPLYEFAYLLKSKQTLQQAYGIIQQRFTNQILSIEDTINILLAEGILINFYTE